MGQRVSISRMINKTAVQPKAVSALFQTYCHGRECGHDPTAERTSRHIGHAFSRDQHARKLLEELVLGEGLEYGILLNDQQVPRSAPAVTSMPDMMPPMYHHVQEHWSLSLA